MDDRLSFATHPGHPMTARDLWARIEIAEKSRSYLHFILAGSPDLPRVDARIAADIDQILDRIARSVVAEATRRNEPIPEGVIRTFADGSQVVYEFRPGLPTGHSLTRMSLAADDEIVAIGND